MTSREVERLLKADGWFLVDQVGSHRHYKHSQKPGKITVPFHRRDLNIKTAESILKQAGLK